MSNALSARLKKKKKGFTLIELIIVMAIIVILAAIAIPSFTTIRDNSKKKADEASADTIKKTIITLLTDGQLKAGASFNIVPTDGGSATFENFDATGDGSISATDLASYFKELKKPQQKDIVKYKVDVNNTTEAVTVTPIATP